MACAGGPASLGDAGLVLPLSTVQASGPGSSLTHSQDCWSLWPCHRSGSCGVALHHAAALACHQQAALPEVVGQPVSSAVATCICLAGGLLGQVGKPVSCPTIGIVFPDVGDR